MNKKDVYVSLEFTPNPNTLKYVVSSQLLDRGAANFTDMASAEKRSPLAVKLLGIAGVSGVMIGRNFVTVTKTEEGDWDAVHQNASSLIEKHLASDEPVLIGEDVAKEGQSETERQIIEILDQEIRPAVAMDGGDITFERYDDGIVYLHLQGACAGCPGATMTLKMGVENRLREAIPEIREVVAI
ncbi:MAG: iron transporter [Bdellovibrionales bacterium GWB1_55_8]|nr:MAG: iron transporter [Bdellovibrionales bacterium GWB1_55_8]